MVYFELWVTHKARQFMHAELYSVEILVGYLILIIL